ncbi:hypothetical protein QCA50_011609 [Cerrena zonata]|uniref:Uncharacterized protein n=1 Tax=Cerrena zonata TaxID=2478898 RepID=A0AAW0G6F5_9APHY
MSAEEPWFSGSANKHICANILMFHWRIASAVNAFPRKAAEAMSKTRWRIGLYREVTAMKDAIAVAMVSGCNGGRFFKQDFSWFNCTQDNTFIVHWDKLPHHIDIPVHVQAFQPFVNPNLSGLNMWWTWDDKTPPLGVQRPPWWDSTEDQIKDYLHKE